MKCKKCGSTKNIKSYVPHWKDGSYAKCDIDLCDEHLKLLQQKHPEINYVWWTKERENDGSYQKDGGK